MAVAVAEFHATTAAKAIHFLILLNQPDVFVYESGDTHDRIELTRHWFIGGLLFGPIVIFIYN